MIIWEKTNQNSNFDWTVGWKIQSYLWSVHPYYLEFIPCPDCKAPSTKRFDFETQYLIVVICHHGLDLRFMGYMLKKSETTIQRIFTGWVVFLSTMFNRLDMVPDHGFLLHKMPDVFINTRHGPT